MGVCRSPSPKTVTVSEIRFDYLQDGPVKRRYVRCPCHGKDSALRRQVTINHDDKESGETEPLRLVGLNSEQNQGWCVSRTLRLLTQPAS